MPPNIMTASEIIVRLGGVTATARALSMPPSTVAMWVRGGIPPRHHPAIAKLASSRAVADVVTREALDAHVAPGRRTR
jgi:DNA-binding transcriptional regulator YdaS (Cro superfamily)